MNVYSPDYVYEVEMLYLHVFRGREPIVGIRELLETQAHVLHEHHADYDFAACVQIWKHFVPLIGSPRDTIMASPFSLEDALYTLAWEHGSADWPAVEALGDAELDGDFESAADAVVTGELGALGDLLGARPELAMARSAFGHGATLLHYVAADGVEIRRQKCPYNAAEVARLLLEAGADVHAKASFVGGSYDTMAMLMRSAPPEKAGLVEGLAEVLKGAGAKWVEP